MNQKRIGIVVTLLLVGAALSGLLLMQHHGEDSAVAAVNQVCGDGQTSGCESVARSAYSVFAGYPLAAWGSVFYLSLLALVLLASQAESDDALAWAGRIACFAAAAALAIDVWLLGIQAVEIKAFCKLCIATYVVNGGVLWAAWPTRRSNAGAGRLLASAWALSTLASVGGIVGWNASLAERAARRAGAILGAPVAASPASPEDARAEAQRLKEILDDPRKYEEYLANKSAKEFETAVVQNIDTRGVPFKGPADAKIRVVEYSDFLCPFCRAIAGAFNDFLPQSQGRISVSFKNYPLDKACNDVVQQTIHPGACWVARGALCATGQGRFWEYHDRVFEAPPTNPQRSDVLRIGGSAGLDPGALAACLDSPGTQSQLKAQIAEANRVGVHGTPTLFLNGKKLPRLDDFIAMVEKEGARLGLPPLAKPAPAVQAPAAH
jgi:protein-disulfide isomerase/uncharacterized membrane protein